MRFAKGDRVTQRFPGKAIVKERSGTIIGHARFRGDWLVKFDDDPSPKPRLISLYEKDLQPESPTILKGKSGEPKRGEKP